MHNTNSASADLAVLIGRFQPFHNGHAMLLRLALDTRPGWLSYWARPGAAATPRTLSTGASARR